MRPAMGMMTVLPNYVVMLAMLKTQGMSKFAVLLTRCMWMNTPNAFAHISCLARTVSMMSSAWKAVSAMASAAENQNLGMGNTATTKIWIVNQELVAGWEVIMFVVHLEKHMRVTALPNPMVLHALIMKRALLETALNTTANLQRKM
jgi:hypothetical protein